ncbi:hypothetical protein [Chitinophaga agri]|uniref:CHAT domain-containing protein n=1 Tax=Chitinophaga agri TaxID=2703787 RepID=A0A6B9Z822_9BACT|nr:hypothetical protein [Chitinophaga agri]QHS58388.1 hypothetical protein GWR21_01900 [Chitinophaga agri]
MIKNILETFHRNITLDSINGNYDNLDELMNLYETIILYQCNDYNNYRNVSPYILTILEENSHVSTVIGIDTLVAQLKKILLGKFEQLDLSIMEKSTGDSFLKKFFLSIETALKEDNQLRLSEANIDFNTLSLEEKQDAVITSILKFQKDAENLNWDEELIKDNLLNLTATRSLLLSLGNVELFYFIISMLFDRLSTSEYFQAGRDIAEEVILASFKDHLPEWGFYNAYWFYSNTNSIHAALLYANLSLGAVLSKKNSIKEKYITTFLWQSMKFFRNVGLHRWVKVIYSLFPPKIHIDEDEGHRIKQTYFTSLLLTSDEKLPEVLLDYLNQFREYHLNGDVNDTIPWLLLLYNIRRVYPNANFSSDGLGFYLSVFEQIVPEEKIKRQKDVIEGGPDLKKYLRESLIKLLETRNAKDFVYDNKMALNISTRLIESSARNKDFSGFLLAMLVKSDYSLVFKNQKNEYELPLKLPNLEDFIYSVYEDSIQLSNELSDNDNGCIIWIGVSEGALVQLSLFNRQFFFFDLAWTVEMVNQLSDSRFRSTLKFEDTVKDKFGSVREVLPEEYLSQSEDIINKIKPISIQLISETSAVYLVIDMILSRFPHNLYLDANYDFVSLKYPTTNILSTEWYLENKGSFKLTKEYSRSIWVPIESGDWALNYLFSNIEDTLHEHKFNIHTSKMVKAPLCSDINIICSHGGENISETQVFYQNGELTHNLNEIIGSGKILIFFVCHSGSMDLEMFRNSITSLIKTFMSKGYGAIIAPVWALDVTIPRYWLPEFLECMDKGLTIDKAVFNANKRVYDRYPSPPAWACLHLFGDPNIRVS